MLADGVFHDPSAHRDSDQPANNCTLWIDVTLSEQPAKSKDVIKVDQSVRNIENERKHNYKSNDT